MRQRKKDGSRVGGLSTGTVEVIVAAVLFGVGLVVIRDSQRLGAGWGSDGPQSGYFPYYIGLLICFSASANSSALRTGWSTEKITVNNTSHLFLNFFITISLFVRPIQSG